jgi:hypothetical protein
VPSDCLCTTGLSSPQIEGLNEDSTTWSKHGVAAEGLKQNGDRNIICVLVCDEQLQAALSEANLKPDALLKHSSNGHFLELNTFSAFQGPSQRQCYMLPSPASSLQGVENLFVVFHGVQIRVLPNLTPQSSSSKSRRRRRRRHTATATANRVHTTLLHITTNSLYAHLHTLEHARNAHSEDRRKRERQPLQNL